MSAQYNRVRVEDLINDSSSSNKSSVMSSSSQQKVAYKCEAPLCGRKFVSEEALEAHHKRSHAPPTAYVCQRCKSSFSTLPNLNKHVSCQQDLLNDKIKYVTSQLTINIFIYTKTRTVHEKIKPFKCDLCPSSFSFRDGLCRHTRMVHDQVRPFSCPFCSLKFKTKAHMSKHSLALHPEKHRVVESQGSSRRT